MASTLHATSPVAKAFADLFPSVATLPFAVGVSLIALTSSALALNECGPAAGAPLAVTCANTANNPHAGGINYATASGLNLTILNGIVVNRTPLDNTPGLNISSTGNDLLRVAIDEGVTITSQGSLSDGVRVWTDVGSHGSIHITSGANISVVIPDVDPPLNPGVGTNGIAAFVYDGTSSGAIRIEQTRNSTINMTGFEGSGLYGLTFGLGSISIEAAGGIVTAGVAGYGINGFILNNAAIGDINIILTATGRIVTHGVESVGLYALNQGFGNAHIHIDGYVETKQASSDGALADMFAPASSGSATITVSDTGSVITRGDISKGLWALTSGLGDTGILTYGSVTTYGAASHGLVIQSLNAANTATHQVEMRGNATVTTSGDGSHGIRASQAGAGTIQVDLNDNARVTTSGAGSHGVNANGATGAVAINVGQAAQINVSGLESFGIRASAAQASVNVNGQVTASGEYGVGAGVSTTGTAAAIQVGAGATITGGWQAAVAGLGPTTGLPSAGVILGSSAGSLLTNAGAIGSASDRAVINAGRLAGPIGATTILNTGAISGFVELAAVAGNSFTNASGGLFDVRHFADTNGDGLRDTKRVALSDFGAADSRFNNQAGATVRLAPVSGDTAVDATGYYRPTTGIDSRPLEAGTYDLQRAGVVQGQFLRLGAFNHAGTIDLRGPVIGNTLVMTSNAAAGGVPGAGTFISDGGRLLLNTVLNAGVAAGGQTGSQSDVLIVDRTQLGAAPTTITISRREGSGAQTVGNGIMLVEVRDKAASAANVFALNGDFVRDGKQAVIGGAYAYNLFHNGIAADAADGNWYLRNAGLSPTLPVYEEYPKVVVPLIDVPTLRQRVGNRYWADPAPATPPAAPTIFCKDAAQNYRCAVSSEQASYYLKDTANSTTERTGMWGRIEDAHGRFVSNDSTSGGRYTSNALKFQSGLDGLLADHDGGRLIAGVTAHYGQIRARVTAPDGAGDITAEGYGVGGTLTWYGVNGFYVDAQAQATWLRTDIHSTTANRQLVSGNKGVGPAFSLEAGKRFQIDRHWTLTPEAQLVYSRVAFDSFTDPFNAVVSLASADSLRGRLGLTAEYQNSWLAADRTLSRVSGYGVANLTNEFFDGTRVMVSGVELVSMNERLWGGLGAGGSYAWNNGKYSVFGEASVNTSLRNFGDSYRLSGTLGARINW